MRVFVLCAFLYYARFCIGCHVVKKNFERKMRAKPRIELGLRDNFTFTVVKVPCTNHYTIRPYVHNYH